MASVATNNGHTGCYGAMWLINSRSPRIIDTIRAASLTSVGRRTILRVESTMDIDSIALFCPSRWATGLCEDLIKQNKGKRRYSTKLIVLIKSATEATITPGPIEDAEQQEGTRKRWKSAAINRLPKETGDAHYRFAAEIQEARGIPDESRGMESESERERNTVTTVQGHSSRWPTNSSNSCECGRQGHLILRRYLHFAIIHNYQDTFRHPPDICADVGGRYRGSSASRSLSVMMIII
ncbi:hypothetical protein J6590_076661 [Homalodisca vitripennis]|nr:hypothetical protein J6590_076661 [Homalodisca vitripennis]